MTTKVGQKTIDGLRTMQLFQVVFTLGLIWVLVTSPESVTVMYTLRLGICVIGNCITYGFISVLKALSSRS